VIQTFERIGWRCQKKGEIPQDIALVIAQYTRSHQRFGSQRDTACGVAPDEFLIFHQPTGEATQGRFSQMAGTDAVPLCFQMRQVAFHSGAGEVFWHEVACDPDDPDCKKRRNDISLGYQKVPNGDDSEYLNRFTQRLNAKLNPQNIWVYAFGNRKLAGLTSTYANTMTTLIFEEATRNAGHIHFNFEGVDVNQAKTKKAPGRFLYPPYTLDELYIIMNDPTKTLCNKTSFYPDGGTEPSQALHMEVCGS